MIRYYWVLACNLMYMLQAILIIWSIIVLLLTLKLGLTCMKEPQLSTVVSPWTPPIMLLKHMGLLPCKCIGGTALAALPAG